MKNYMTLMTLVMATVMVSFLFSACTEKEDFDNISRTIVDPSVVTVTDTIINVDTVWVPTIDTLVIDSTTPGQTRLVLDKHVSYGQWSGNGATRTITATHEVKTVVIPDGGTATTADSVVFNEVGTMTWSFPTYDHNVNGSYTADENGCSGLGATCTFTWTYNVPTQYAPYFEGECEMWPTQVVVNGTTATVVTKHGTTSRTANYTITVDIPEPPTPDSVVISRNATWRHIADCGQWSGNGATRTITLHCWCVESTKWSTGSTTKDSVLVAGHGTMTWNFPSYTSSQDGSYTASATGCNALGATCSVSWTYDVANIQGRTYTHTADCSLVPNGINVVGTTATVTTAHGTTARTANYTITINTPTPADTIDIFHGKIVYYSITASYSSYSGEANVPFYVNVITMDVTPNGGVYTWYTAPYASNASSLNFTNRGTISSAAYNHIVGVSNFTAGDQTGNRRGLALCLNSTVGAAGAISTVMYHPNSGNPQIKYRDMNGVLIGVCSAVTSTINGTSVVEPVQEGGIVNSFTINGDVVY